MGSKEWFDLDLCTSNLKINRDHLRIGRNPCTKFGIDPVKWSKDVERTTLGLQTDRPTNRPTYRTTDSCKTICPLFQGGHKKGVLYFKSRGPRFNCLFLLFLAFLLQNKQNESLTEIFKSRK